MAGTSFFINYLFSVNYLHGTESLLRNWQYSAGQGISTFYGTCGFITIFTKAGQRS